jgi:hypothetical protein
MAVADPASATPSVLRDTAAQVQYVGFESLTNANADIVQGYCGTTKDHCQAPDCLIDFGPACDGNKTPGGASTRNDARPQKGSVAYGGGGVYACKKAGTVAITYDDG